MRNTAFGQRVRQLRAERGFSKSDLAQRAGVSPTAVWNWETNGTQPRHETLQNITNAFEIKLEELLKSEINETIVAPEAIELTTIRDVQAYAERAIAKIANVPLENVKVRVEIS